MLGPLTLSECFKRSVVGLYVRKCRPTTSCGTSWSSAMRSVSDVAGRPGVAAAYMRAKGDDLFSSVRIGLARVSSRLIRGRCQSRKPGGPSPPPFRKRSGLRASARAVEQRRPVGRCNGQGGPVDLAHAGLGTGIAEQAPSRFRPGGEPNPAVCAHWLPPEQPSDDGA
jgi:hypothetical protein